MSTSSAVSQPVLLRRPRPPTNSTIINIINNINLEKSAHKNAAAADASRRQDAINAYRGNRVECNEHDDDDYILESPLYPASTNRSRQSFLHFQPFTKTPARHNSLQEVSSPDVATVLRSGRSLVQPVKLRGPDPLPARPAKQKPTVFYTPLDDDLQKYYQPPKFTLQDFIVQFSTDENVPVDQVQQTVYSPFTYRKLQSVLQERCCPRNTNLAVQELQLPADLPHHIPRIPQKQLLIEMAAIIKEHLSRVSGVEMRSAFRPLIGGPIFGQHPSPCAEILFYHDPSTVDERQTTCDDDLIESEFPGTDSIVHGPTTRHFNGSKRSGSPFATGDDSLISPAELGVLDSLLSGGRVLSLKAQFISMLPDVQLLIDTIEYINLSFNNFQIIPVDIFSMPYLTILLLRNNPLREIPGDIEKLHNLKTCVVSFCLLTSLPPELFTLTQLETLDVSYNLLTAVPNDVRNATSLEELNVQGNQLTALPTGILRLKNLKRLIVSNNFMHPVFWKDTVNNEIQSLFELSCVAVSLLDASQLDHQRYSTFAELFRRGAKCEACGRTRFSNTVQIIRPVSQICGVRNVPIVFRCCSVECKNRFKSATNGLLPVLYGPETGNRTS